MARHQRTQFDLARDELMSHIHRCGVLKASEQHQAVWFEETMEYMAERYTELNPTELKELQQIGERFCQPVIQNGIAAEEDSSTDEMVGAA